MIRRQFFQLRVGDSFTEAEYNDRRGWIPDLRAKPTTIESLTMRGIGIALVNNSRLYDIETYVFQ